MLYHIANWCPEPRMNGAGFSIELFPEWKIEVKKVGLSQENIDNVIAKMGKYWLESHGFKGDLYSYRDIRVSWGEWGPEHISVPGNACGLDIYMNSPFGPKNGSILSPHNVDSLSQASLLLTIFLFVANYLVIQIKCKHLN